MRTAAPAACTCKRTRFYVISRGGRYTIDNVIARLPVVQRQQMQRRGHRVDATQEIDEKRFLVRQYEIRKGSKGRRHLRRLDTLMSESARLITINPTSIDDALVVEAGRAHNREACRDPDRSGLRPRLQHDRRDRRCIRGQGPTGIDPLVHVDGVAMADTLIDGGLPTVATRLAAAFWPGPLTMVLPKTEIVPDAITSGGPTVGVGVRRGHEPDHGIRRARRRRAPVRISVQPAARRRGSR